MQPSRSFEGDAGIVDDRYGKRDESSPVTVELDGEEERVPSGGICSIDTLQGECSVSIHPPSNGSLVSGIDGVHGIWVSTLEHIEEPSSCVLEDLRLTVEEVVRGWVDDPGLATW